MGIAAAAGVSAAERATGIPKETIQYWTHRPEFAQFRTRAREDVLEGMWVGIQVGAQELVKGMTSDAPLHQKAQAWAALTDRYLLLAGEATSRSEHRDITDADAAGIDALEQVIAGSGPWALPARVEPGSNGTGKNGKH